MKRIAAICLLMGLLLAAWAGPAQAGMITFASQAQVSGEQVTLMDLVAEGAGLSAETKARLQAVRVMTAPDAGQQVKLEGLRLRQLIRQAQLGREVSVLIPQQVLISRAVNRVTSDQLAQAYLKALKRRLGARAKDADIHDLRAGRDLIVPPGEVELRVRFLSQRLLGRVPAVVSVRVAGRTVAQATVVAQVDLYGKMVVAARSLPGRHILDPEDMRLIKANLSAAGRGVVTDPEQIKGMRTRAPMSPGEPLHLARLERAPLIKRGEVVTMFYAGDGLKVSALGKALQTGYLGSRITLSNLASKRKVYGRVTASGQVAVEF